jgi:hypothetical protein
MLRLTLVIGSALVLAAVLAPAVLATDDSTPAATVSPAPTPVQGEIVIDPTFITTTPDPAGVVAGATGRPNVTPPPTDTATVATTPGTGLQVLLVLGVVGPLLALLGSREPNRRRR